MVCKLWGGIRPHPSGHPGSVWDLPYRTWLIFQRAADDYVKKMRESNDGR